MSATMTFGLGLLLGVLGNELFSFLPWLTAHFIRLTARIDADNRDEIELIYAELMDRLKVMPGTFVPLGVAIGFLLKVAVLRRCREALQASWCAMRARMALRAATVAAVSREIAIAQEPEANHAGDVSEGSTDANLMARANEGDGVAWAELVRRYAPLLWSICRSYRLSHAECEDVGTGVWIALVEALPQLQAPAALPGWMVITTQRVCLEVLHGNRQHAYESDDLDVEDGQLGVHERHLVDEGMDAALRMAFAQLPPECQRLLLLLMHIPQPSYANVAAVLNWPVNTIGPMRARALEQLRRSPALSAWVGATREDAPGVRKPHSS